MQAKLDQQILHNYLAIHSLNNYYVPVVYDSGVLYIEFFLSDIENVDFTTQNM